MRRSLFLLLLLGTLCQAGRLPADDSDDESFDDEDLLAAPSVRAVSNPIGFSATPSAAAPVTSLAQGVRNSSPNSGPVQGTPTLVNTVPSAIIRTPENSKVSPVLKFKIKLVNKPATPTVPVAPVVPATPTSPKPLVSAAIPQPAIPQAQLPPVQTLPAKNTPSQVVVKSIEPAPAVISLQPEKKSAPVQAAKPEKIDGSSSEKADKVASVKLTQRAPPSAAPQSQSFIVNQADSKPSQPAQASPNQQSDLFSQIPTPKPKQDPIQAKLSNQSKPVGQPEKLPPGVYSHTKRTLVDLIPAGSRVYTESSFSQRGNLKTINLKKFYINSNNQKIYTYEETTVEKININIPESNELEPAKNRVAPFFGFINDSKTFTNWDGLCQAIFQQLNVARTQPKQYAQYIQEQLDSFTDEYSFSYGTFTTASVEGKGAWKEAIDYLNQQTPRQALRRVDCLDRTADGFTADAAANLILGHIDSKGRAPTDRMRQKCSLGSGGQNIAYGMMSARGAIMQLIVDDDVADRGHRLNIFKEYTQVGLACRSYPEYGTITVNDFLY